MYRLRTDIISNNPDVKQHLVILPSVLSDLIDTMISEIPLLERRDCINQEAVSCIWFIYRVDDSPPVLVEVGKKIIKLSPASSVLNSQHGTVRVLIHLKQSWLDRTFSANPGIHEAVSQLMLQEDPANDVQPMSPETRARWRQSIAELLRNLWPRK